MYFLICSLFICIYKPFFFFLFPHRRLVSHFGSSFKAPLLLQFNKEVYSAKLGCYLKWLFCLDSFQQFCLSPVVIKKCLDLPISLTSDLIICISLYFPPWYLYICVAAYPLDKSLAPFHGVCGFPAYYIHIHLHLFVCFSWLSANLIMIPSKKSSENVMLSYGIL